MNRGAFRHVANAAGLSLELNRDGGVRRILFRHDVVNLFMGNGMEPGPANIWLRVRRGGGVEAVPLLGPQSPLHPLSWERALTVPPRPPEAGERVGERGRDDVFETLGEWQGIRISLRLALADQDATWCWQVRLENRSTEERTVDLVFGQDIALASASAVRLNEHYVSQYVDLSPMEHARCGWVVAARQNLAQGGRHPWAVVGSLRRATSFSTDGLQLFGLAQRLGGMPAGVRERLPGQRLQHEHAMAAVQDEAVTLAPGARWDGGFFVALEADHPLATSVEDLAAVDAALSWARSLEMPSLDRASEDGGPGDSTLFSVAPLLDCRDLDGAELRRLFPSTWRHEERDGAGLLSFFCGEDVHVVLRAKEARTQRPHGHILRTGEALVPEESSLTSTVWMSGVFHSMVTQGHVSINRFLSTAHSWLGLFRSHGLRVFVQVEGQWQLLGVPSAFEMRPGSCRWIYRHAHGAIEVTSAVHDGAHALSLRGRVLDGPPLTWLATLHVALGGDDGNALLPIPWRMEGRDVVVGMPEGSDLHARFPDGTFVVAPHADTALAGVHGDRRLFTDGKRRGLPFLVLEGRACSDFGLDLLGRLVPDVHASSSPPPLPALSAPGANTVAAELGRLGEMLPWLLHDAQVHQLSPRGLEQYSGGGWGTRDVCQGPLEMLLALDCPAAARDLLLRVFAAQDEDGDWPQWFQFIERERELRALDSHGDIVFWPLLGAAQYVLSTGDASLLDAQAPFHSAQGRPGTSASVLQHVDRALGVIQRRRVAGTALAAYGHGDWNDSLQPADPSMRDRLCSTWTVILHHQTLTALARAMKVAGHGARATSLVTEAERIRRGLRDLLMVDGVLAGYVLFSPEGGPEPLLHPRDRRTGVRYSLLPMMHAILEDLLTPKEAATHLSLMREHLWAPDGARLFDRPLTYRGGIERLFQRAETSAFFGREIGLMYTHAHLRFAQMQAHVGDARGLLRSLALAHPVQLRERLPQASLRQANCYFSSSDAAFRDRYEAQESYARVAAGTVALDGGWRVYSSGPGIALSLIVTSLLGVRREGSALVIDPVIAPELSGLRAEVPIMGRRVRVEYQVDRLGYSPQVLVLNGRRLGFSRVDNPYRAGGGAIPLEGWAALLRPDAPDVLRVELS
jgi:cellobiose phosphorylase